jgi:hypothetical protein
MTDLATPVGFDLQTQRDCAGTQVSDRPLAAVATTRTARSSFASVRHVTLVIDPARLRNVHREIAIRLTRAADVRVTLRRGPAADPLPSSIGLLLGLERLIDRSHGSRLSDPLDLSRWSLPEPAADDPPDLTIDFCGGETTPGRRTLRVLYDGFADEAVLIGALLAGRMPVMEIVDAQADLTVSRGTACADNAGTILGALECVLARVVNLVVSAARGWEMLGPARPATTHTPRLRSIVAFEAKALVHSAVRRLYHLCCYAPHWRTCWRFVDGPDLWQTGTVSGTSWNVIPDPGFRFYTDPFPFVHEGRTYVFVEDLDHRTNKGIISVVPFDERGPSGPAQPVLEEPWHLSYPFVFAHDGEVWMIPESSANRTITLYRAQAFPHRWVRETKLVADVEASDATIVHHGGCFWMFAATRDGAGSWSDTLSLFSAPDPRGPWRPHPGNPILIDQTAARPAGAIVKRDGKLWRPTQDCSAGYGTGVGLVEILRLDHEAYEQKLHTVLHPDPSWPGRRFHTLNRAGRLECIDGAAHSPRNRWLAQRLQSWSGRREPPPGLAARNLRPGE